MVLRQEEPDTLQSESAVQVPAVSTVCSPVHLELVQVEVVVAQSVFVLQVSPFETVPVHTLFEQMTFLVGAQSAVAVQLPPYATVPGATESSTLDA